MHKGSCLCGAVNYEVRGELGPITLCHCSRCRKAGGSAFAAVSPINAADLHIVAGNQLLGEFKAESGLRRFFCKGCGSPIYSKRDSAPDLVRLRIGTLDTPFSGKPSAHIFTASKAEWFDIHDDAPQYVERP
jgi:hypothetical protein